MIGIDLAEEKQAIAVVDHDGRVLARKTVRAKAFRLGAALDQAVEAARAKGYAHVTVACEPTGPRWMQVQRLCGERGVHLLERRVHVYPLQQRVEVNHLEQRIDVHCLDHDVDEPLCDALSQQFRRSFASRARPVAWFHQISMAATPGPPPAR